MLIFLIGIGIIGIMELIKFAVHFESVVGDRHVGWHRLEVRTQRAVVSTKVLSFGKLQINLHFRSFIRTFAGN